MKQDVLIYVLGIIILIAIIISECIRKPRVPKSAIDKEYIVELIDSVFDTRIDGFIESENDTAWKAWLETDVK